MYKFLKIIALFLIVLTCCSDQEQDDNSDTSDETQVSGTLSSDTVWTLDKSPYIVVDDVVVERGITLTIEPQVEIRFDQGKGLTVKGILIADGSAGFTPSDESELIKFRSNRSMPDMGDWQGIKFDNTNDDESVISYSKIEFAKIGIDCFSSSPRISDSFVKFNETGIVLDTDSLSDINHNVISSNIEGISIHQSYALRDMHRINRNTISYNETGIMILFTEGKIEYNNFIDNEGYSITIKWSKVDIYATNNWWNTDEIDEIEKQFYDKKEDGTLGEVFYVPYSVSHISDAYPRLGTD